MLTELFAYLTTPCPRSVRRMGYLYEAVALRGRYRRCQAHWKDHLERSRRAVLEAAGTCRDHGAAVILGSGLLLDVPLADLAERFQEIVLADIVHLPQARRYARRFGNVKLRTYDVSTVVERLLEHIESGRRELPDPVIDDVGLACAPSLVVSLNILSQLPVLPRHYALAHMPGLQEDVLRDWCLRIIASHHASLRALPCDAYLIADYAYTKRNRRGAVLEEGPTIHGFTLPAPLSGWTWRIAPLGEQSRRYAKELSVGVWRMSQDAT